MRGKALLVVACLIFAGCASQGDGGPPAGDDDGTAGTGDGSAVLTAPAAWAVGDHWTYQISGEEIEDREASFVVADATDAEFVVETTDRGVAFFDARDDTTEISYLGDQSRGTRAGSQGDARVEYWRWPLELNASWTTTWDGEERTVRVVGVGDTTAELVSRGPEGDLHARYTYDAEAGWFGEARFFDDGTETFAMELVDFGANFSETYVIAELTTVLEANWTGNDGGSWEGTVGAGAEDFWYQVSYAVDGPGDVGLGWSWTNGTQTEGDDVAQEPCPCDPTTVEGTVEATAADWRWDGGIVSTGDAAEYAYLDVTVYLRDFVEHGV